MKKGTVIGIALAVISIIALGILAVYLTLQFSEETFFSTADRAESEADAAMEALFQSQTQAQTQTEPPQTEAAASDPMIWVGDSRTLGMQDALEDPGADVYIGAAGEGYEWFSEKGLPELEKALKQYPEAPVILNFGVNDYDNMTLYLDLYQSLVSQHPDTDFYFLSVNPIEPTLCDNITNEEISDFNAHLKEAFPDTYIDSFTQLMINQTVPIDGIHYTEEDYLLIHDFVLAQIEYKESKKAE